MTWSEALHFATGPGVAVVVGALLSVLAEYWVEYDELPPKKKRLVFGALCLFVPVAATLLGVATDGWTLTVELIWQAILAGLTALGSGTLVHTRQLDEQV